MTYTRILNTLGSYERQFGAATFSVHGHGRRCKKHDADRVRQPVLRRSGRRSDAAAYVVAPITDAHRQRLREGRHRRRSTSRSTSTEEPRTATLERVWLDDPRPRAGRTVPLKVLLRTYRGEDVVRTMPIDDPGQRQRHLSMMVSDGARLAQTEQREARAAAAAQRRPDDTTLNKARRNNTLYVKLLGSDAGAVVNGEVLSSLPPSVLAVLEADRSGGNFNPLHSATLGEWELPTEHAVSGSRTLTIHRLAELTHVDSHFQPIMALLARAARALVAASLSRAGRPLHASSPKFFQAATQADFLKGDVENLSIDSRGQLMLGPATELVYETPAPFLWSMIAGARRLAVHRHRQRGQGLPRRSAGQGLAVLRQRRARSPRAGARARTAASTSARRPTARSTRSIATAPRRRSSIREDKYIWALAVDAQGQPLRRHRREGRHLQDHARRQRRAVLQDQGDARDRAGLRQGGQPARRHRIAGPRAARRRRRQGVRAARLAVPGNPRAALRRQGRAVRRRRQRPPGGGGAAPVADRHGATGAAGDAGARAGCRRSVSTEITVDRRSSTSAAPASTGIAARGSRRVEGRRLPHRARRPLGSAVGIARRLAVRPDVRRQRRADRRHRQQGQDLPARRRSAAADAARARRAQQVTAFYKDARGRAVLRHRESRQAVPAVARARAARHLRVRSRATRRWCRRGARSAGAARRRPAARSSSSRDRATPKRRTTPGAPGRRPTRSRTARRSPARRRATCSGARC